MNKKLFFLLFVIMLFLPISVRASEYDIENYYIDATVQNNGDLSVKETFIMNGSYRGYERIIKYANNTSSFNPGLSSYQGSNLNNGNNIVVNKVGAIDIPNTYDFSIINNNVLNFEKTDSAEKGDSGVYTQSNIASGVDMLIYNPSSKNRAFYVEYTINNIAVKWNDIGELNWTMFSDEQKESIHNLEIYVHLPNNKSITRVWTHGPLTGENSIKDSNTLYARFINVTAGQAMDIRSAFDTNVISESKKVENYNILDKIVAYETTLADQANAQRADYEKEQEALAEKYVSEAEKTNTYSDYKQAKDCVNDLLNQDVKDKFNKRLDVVYRNIINKMYNALIINAILFVAWLVFFISEALNYREKYILKPKSEFNQKYFRDIPSDFTPATVEYLLDHKITTKSISATILDLIRKKLITYEKQNKTYLLKYVPNSTKKLTESEQELIKWLFEEVGNENQVSLLEFTNYGRNHSTKFISKYNSWSKISSDEAQNNNFYSSEPRKYFPFTLATFLSFVMLFVTIGLLQAYSFIGSYFSVAMVLSFCSIVIAMVVYYSYTNYNQYSQNGINEKSKWLALKNFLNDFGNFKDKELPDIILWERYLVFAFIFGCAKKLRKQMEIKYNELYPDQLPNIYMTNLMFDLNSSIERSVTSAYSNAIMVNSNFNGSGGFGGGFSSGGGFGGGSTGGGGFGGGGGGGGRF